MHILGKNCLGIVMKEASRIPRVWIRSLQQVVHHASPRDRTLPLINKAQIKEQRQIQIPQRLLQVSR